MKLAENNYIFLHILLSGLAYRIPMKVVDVWSYLDGLLGHVDYPICPQCGGHIEHEYQRYCSLCGQALDWSRFEKMYLDSEED